MTEQEYSKIIAKNLKRIMYEHNKSQADVCRELDLNKATLSSWMNGTRAPRMSKIDMLCRYFGCTRSDIMEPEKQNTVISRRIPVLGRIAAGTLTDAVENVLDYVEIPEAWRGEYFALKVRGSSMMPRITEDDILICRRQGEAESGDIVIAQAGRDEATVKKLVIMDNGISLQPFNPEFDPMFYTWEQKETIPVEILGKVVESRHRF